MPDLLWVISDPDQIFQKVIGYAPVMQRSWTFHLFIDKLNVKWTEEANKVKITELKTNEIRVYKPGLVKEQVTFH